MKDMLNKNQPPRHPASSKKVMLWLEDLTFLQFEFKLREYLKTHHYQEHKVTNLDISDFYAVYKESGLSFEEWIKKMSYRF